MSNSKIVKYKKPFRPNVASMILIIVILYVAAVAWSYLSKEHISIYEVNETSIADDSTITGFLLRNEKVMVSEESGYVNFYHADHSKIGKSEVVYTLDSTGAVSEMLNQVKTNPDTTANDINRMREIIQEYYVNYNPASYYQTSTFHYNIENAIFEQNRNNLYRDLKKQMSKNNFSEDFKRYRAKESGIISYSVDGYENATLDDVTPELFHNVSAVERKQLSSAEKIEASTPVYRLVTNEEWSIVIPVTDSLYEKIMDSTSLRITVKKDNISFNTNVVFQEKGGERFAILTTSRFMERYLNDRFLDIELNLNAASGFKIPNSSILKKEMTLVPEEYTKVGGDGENPGVLKVIYDENGSRTTVFTSLADFSVTDGKYCVEQSVLKPGDIISNPANDKDITLQSVTSMEGVYCVNTGYCVFRRIEKIYENNEYTIVSPTTKGGISNFDHIIVNPERMNENDFVQ